MNLFEYSMERFKFGKNINIVECFSGIGTQAMAWKRLAKKYDLTLNFVAISEIDKNAIKSYEAIHGKITNLGGIGSFERFPSGIDFCSWSFPCQDISLAGKQKGMNDGSRSNYGYVFLDTIKNTPKEERPKILFMENVPALISAKFQKDYAEIHRRLEEMGYTSWGGLLNAKDYGIPQNRERIFIMSILGEWSYTFPKPFHLKKKLKDYLEHQVDEKYYLTNKQIESIQNWKAYEKPLEAMVRTNRNKYSPTITTRSGAYAVGMILIPEATKKGYAESEEGDGVYLDRPHQKRGVVQKGMIQTIKTQPGDVGVVVKDTRTMKERLADDLIQTNTVKEGDVINHSYTSSKQRPELKDFIEKEDGIMPTLHTRPDIFGVTVKAQEKNKLRIRKLTPRETWRLMGVNDEDFDKAKESGVSDAQLYKQAGNAIVVDVLEKIFENLI